MDCTEAGEDTCKKFNVSAYPTINIFKNGKVYEEYDGPDDSGTYNNIYYIV